MPATHWTAEPVSTIFTPGERTEDAQLETFYFSAVYHFICILASVSFTSQQGQ
jgi:hypothetical protein